MDDNEKDLLTDDELENVSGGGCDKDDYFKNKVRVGDRVRLMQCRCHCGKNEPVGTVVRVDPNADFGKTVYIDPDCCHYELRVGGGWGFSTSVLRRE